MKDETDKNEEQPVLQQIVEIRGNFLYPEDLNKDHATYGAAFLSGPILRFDGDWTGALPPVESQYHNVNGRGTDSSACYVEANQHVIATIEEAVIGEVDNNYSARFNALLSGGTEQGGDPVAAGNSIRHDGMVTDAVMPFSDDINNWHEFHSWQGVDEAIVRAAGKADLTTKDRNFGVVVSKEMSLNAKHAVVVEGLKRSPIAVSIWGAVGSDGQYLPKTPGVPDTHLVAVVKEEIVDGQYITHIRDTYTPFDKTLPPNYNFDFGMGWKVTKLTPPTPPLPTNPNWLTDILKNLLDVLKDLSSWITTQKEVPPTDPTSPVLNIIEPTFNPPDRLQEFCKAIESFEGYYKGSRSERNRNPGNCRFSPIGYLSIYEPVKRDKDNFAIFPTYELGFLYLKNLVKHKCQKHPDWTILQFFQEFAPSSDNNDPIHYAETVASNCGLLATNKLKDVVQLKGLLGNQSNMPSTSVVAIVVNLLVTLLPYIGVKVDGGSIDTTIQTLTAIVTGIWLWVQNRRLNTALAGTGKEVTLGGLKA